MDTISACGQQLLVGVQEDVNGEVWVVNCKVAVHVDKVQQSFSGRWLVRLRELSVEVQEVSAFDDNVGVAISDCDALMWHWYQFDPKAMLVAKQLTLAFEAAGKAVFPSSRCSWHFDDKVGQKYLLEAVGAPLVATHVFFDPASAKSWLDDADFPLVFKLRGGAGSQNVRLVKTRKQALALVRRAFGRGFSPRDRLALLKDRVWQLQRDRSLRAIYLLARGLVRLVVPTKLERVMGRERGYVYFQQFLPDNRYDTRVIVIGHRAFGIRRYNREGDFRASGSGLIAYDPAMIDLRCVQIAFDVSQRLDAECLAYDFVYDANDVPLIVEVSYAFVGHVYEACPGYWDNALNWYPGAFNAQSFMVDDLVERLLRRRVGIVT